MARNVVRKDAKQIEKRIKQEESWNGNHVPEGGEILSHGSLHSSGIRHGRLIRMGMVQTKFGPAMQYMGTERLGQLSVTGITPAGTVIDKRSVDPTIGVVLEPLSIVYEKFYFNGLMIEHVPETSQVNAGAFGSVYEGMAFDPSSEDPSGEDGVDSMATWNNGGKPSVMINEVKDTRRRKLDIPLSLESQSPLFVTQTGDKRFWSQGELFAIAGTQLGLGATTINIGEWFFHYKILLFQLNVTPSDIPTGTVCFASDSTPAFIDFGIPALSQFTGDSALITQHNALSTGVTFSCPGEGTYILETTAQALNVTQVFLTNAVVTCIANPVLNGRNLAGVHLASTFSAGGVLGTCENPFSGVPTAGSALEATIGVSTPAIALSGITHTTHVFTCRAGTPWLYVSPTVTANGPMMIHIRIAKLDGKFHADGIITTRPTLNTVLTARQEYQKWKVDRLALENPPYQLTADDKLILTKFLINNLDNLDVIKVNFMIDLLDLPIRKTTCSVMILPALAAIATWAVTTFGPIVADKALKWIVSKINDHK